MIAVAVILCTVLLTSVSLNVFLAVQLYTANKLAAAKSDELDKRLGELESRLVDDANAATKTAVASEQAQQKRADGLEKELADEASRPPAADGVQQLASITGTDTGHPDGK